MPIPYKGKQHPPLQIVCPLKINISQHKSREIHRKFFKEYGDYLCTTLAPLKKNTNLKALQAYRAYVYTR